MQCCTCSKWVHLRCSQLSLSKFRALVSSHSWRLARLGVKPRLCRSCWRAFASTYPLMLPSTSSREALDLVLWTDGSVPFGKGGSGVLAICSLCGTEATLSFSAGPVCSSFPTEACAILHALCWSQQHQQVCYFFLPYLSSIHEKAMYRYVLDGKSALAWELPFPGHLSST